MPMSRLLLLIATLVFLPGMWAFAQITDAPDSLLIATMQKDGDGVSLEYPDEILRCAMEKLFSDGTMISDVKVGRFGAGWGLMCEGQNGDRPVVAALTLEQDDRRLFVLSSATRWDRCQGSDCEECSLMNDGEGRIYCDCSTGESIIASCDHSLATGNLDLAALLASCSGK